MSAQSPAELVKKKCLPCEGGVKPITLPEAEAQLKQLQGWQLTHDGQRIRKDWIVKNFMAGMEFFNRCAESPKPTATIPTCTSEGYRNVSVELWTHAIGGLSENDLSSPRRSIELPIELKKLTA